MGNYIETATEALHDALRIQGFDPAKDLTPELERGYVLLVLTRGTTTRLGDVHDAWAVARAVERPDHPDLVPFEQLSAETKAYDRPFASAIRNAARYLAGEGTE